MKAEAFKLIVGLVLGIWLLRSCSPPVRPSVPLETINVKPGDKAVLAVNFRKGTIGIAGTHEKLRAPVSSTGLRRGNLIVKNDAEKGTTVEFKAQKAGFTFEPGIGAGFDGKPCALADVQFYYWRNFGAHIGASYRGSRYAPRGFVGASLRPFDDLPNTSFIVGVGTDKELLIGVRVGL